MLFQLFETYHQVGGTELLGIIEIVIKDTNGNDALISTMKKSNSFKSLKPHLEFLRRDRKNMLQTYNRNKAIFQKKKPKEIES